MDYVLIVLYTPMFEVGTSYCNYAKPTKHNMLALIVSKFSSSNKHFNYMKANYI